MEKISLNTLYKLNKLIDNVEDDELALFLDKISQDLTQEAVGGDNALLILYNYVSEVENKFSEVVKAALGDDNADTNEVLKAGNNVKKALSDFLEKINTLMVTGEEVQGDTMAQEVQDLTTNPSPLYNEQANIKGFGNAKVQ